MIWTVYFITLTYFLIGGIGFHYIERKKGSEIAYKNREKFVTYFLIINTLYLSIAFFPLIFRCLSAFIILLGLYELLKLFQNSGYTQKVFFLCAFFLLGTLSVGFYFFGNLNKELILFSFLVLSIFDSFSQITGQLWGKRKILPQISPNKTLEGTVGGSVVALLSALLLNELTSRPIYDTLFLSAGIVFFAFTGDAAASAYKRKYMVKNFSELIPGHGGILDRFDSLIAGGAWVALSVYVFNI
jgi:phosphatidate cytidylyltransferase